MAIKCHSGFVHYNMFHNNHCHGGGNNYGSIFNIKHNCGGGTNFWGGLGAGLGFGLSGMFSGLFGGIMGGFGNMFGGFGLGNMFGGFGMGGFGSPFGGGWGSVWGDGLSRLFGKKDKADKDPVKDIDNAKIAELTGKLNELKAGEVTEVQYNKLKAEIEKAIKDTDTISKDDDLKTYKNLLNELNNKKNAKPANKLENADADQGQRLGDADADQGQGLGDAGTGSKNGPKVTIGGEDIPLADLTADNIQALTKEQIDKLEADHAKTLLEKLELLCKDNSGRDGVQATTSLNALRLAEKAGLPVALAHNKALDDKTGANVDPYLDGMVSKIEYNETTQIITYHLEDENGIYKVECKAGSTEIETKELIKNKTGVYKTFNTATYEIKTDDDDPYAVRDGLPPSASSV